MKRLRNLTAAFLAVSLLLVGCGESEEPTVEESKTSVEVQTAVSDSIKSELVYAGQVKPNETVNVTSKVSGQVQSIKFDVGDTVNAGDVMFTLNQKDIQDQIKQLKSQLNVSNASVNSAQTSLNQVNGSSKDNKILSLQTAIDNAKETKDNVDVQIASAEANIKNAKVSIENAKVAVENAKASLDNITTKYNNMKVLYNAGTITKNDFDAVELSYTQAQKAYTQAQNSLTSAQNALTTAENSKSQAQISKNQANTAYEQAKKNYDIYVNKTTNENTESAKAGVSTAVASKEAVQTQIDVLQSTLNDTSVKAPISGVITEKNISETNMVSAQSAPFVIVDMSKVTVDVNVSERLINVIKVGDSVDVNIATVDNKNIKGVIKTITPSADNTNTYPVKIEIENSDGAIKPGMFAEIHFVESQKDNTIVVPRNAIIESDDVKYVYVIEDNKAVKKEVETGIDNGESIEIISGVNMGEDIVVKGQSYVNDGDEVNVVSGSKDSTQSQNNDTQPAKEE